MRILASASVAAFCLSLMALLGTMGPAAAKPTDAQLSAIKSNCRSDFMSNCWGTPRGGAEAFQCLKEHMAKLSPGCAQAVKAVSPPAAPPPPTPAVAKPETSPAAPAPSTATAKPAAPITPPPASEAKAEPAAAPKSTPATPPKAASEPSAKHAKAEAPAQPAKAPNPAPAAAPAEAPPIIGFIPPRKKLMVLRNCRQDLDTYCPDVSYGEGRQLHCLFSNKASLTPDCQGALARLTQ